MVDLVQAASIIIPLVVVAWIVERSLHIVRPTQRGLVERNGRYNRFVNTGLTFLFPVIDRLIKVNVTEQITEPEPQVIITKDRLNLSINMVVSYKVRPDEASVKNSEYSVNNYRQQIDILGHVALRDILGSMVYEEANQGRDVINQQLLTRLKTQTDAWGIDIVRAEIKDIRPPQNIQDSMNKIIEAENTKKSAVNQADALAAQADGQKRAAIAQAEGERQAQILKAEGLRQATISIAEGDAGATKLRNEALTTYFKDNAVVFKKLEAIQSVMNNAKIIVPEGNLTTLILNEAEKLDRQLLPLRAPEDKESQKRQ
ncbi:MAG: SPFH/Band 7/PHB domain protein [Thaumarchaeota archaeon]|nr:MAG: SPFH/Band 7/PHB domain protein [Nitrososphaerota archaeon]